MFHRPNHVKLWTDTTIINCLISCWKIEKRTFLWFPPLYRADYIAYLIGEQFSLFYCKLFHRFYLEYCYLALSAFLIVILNCAVYVRYGSFNRASVDISAIASERATLV